MYTVIIFCLSIGIILPVNYSGTNGEKQSRGAGGGGGGYSRFQVSGVIKGVFGFEIFNCGIFLGRKIWQVFLEWFVLNRDFLGDYPSPPPAYETFVFRCLYPCCGCSSSLVVLPRKPLLPFSLSFVCKCVIKCCSKTQNNS